VKESVSVVIPVKNGIKTIKKCLDAILSQTIKVNEIVVVDSGSTDGTKELLGEYECVKLIEIPPADFNHGETRNLGVRHATCDLVVLTVQDAWAKDEYWIENLLKGLEGNDAVAVCGQQIVPHDHSMNPVQWFRSYSTPLSMSFSYKRDEFLGLPVTEQKRICSWDNVTALYKRDVLLKLPFRRTLFAEDKLWSRDALIAGHTIAYNFAARVYHYHHEDAELAYKRAFAEIYSTYKVFGLLPETPKLSFALIKHMAKLLHMAEGLTIAEKVKWWNYNIDLHKSYKRAVEDFNTELEAGEQKLEVFYMELCGKVSVPDYLSNELAHGQ